MTNYARKEVRFAAELIFDCFAIFHEALISIFELNLITLTCANYTVTFLANQKKNVVFASCKLFSLLGCYCCYKTFGVEILLSQIKVVFKDFHAKIFQH